MSILAKIKSPAWSSVFSLILAAGATLPPNLTDLLRGALLIAAVLAATRTFYMTEYGGRSVKKTVVFGLVCAVLAITIFAGIHVFDAKVKIAPPVQASGEEQQTNSQSGPIEQRSTGANSPNIVGNGNRVTINANTPASLPQPTFQEESEEISFSLGELGFTDTQRISNLKKGPHTPFYLEGYAPVILSIKGGVLLYDIKFWGGPGKPPIEVKNNKFTVRVPNWDRNFNANAFEVVDSKNIPILQVIRKTATHIIVNGIFPLPDGLLLPAGPNGAIMGVRAVPPDFMLQPIFRYPSWKYLGQYSPNSN